MFKLFKSAKNTDLRKVAEKQLQKNVRVIESLRDYDAGKKIFQPVPPKSISQAYELLHSKGFIAFPLTQSAEDKASAIVATITESYFGREIYETVEEKAVAYLYLLIKDHPFTDGNKRTASLVFSMVCDINELRPRFGNGYPTLDELAVFIEKVREQDHQKVIRLIAKVLFEGQE